MQEMVKSQKIYSEEEKQAHETRVKAMSVEEKLRRRSTNLFNSMAQLHRNHAKVTCRAFSLLLWFLLGLNVLDQSLHEVLWVIKVQHKHISSYLFTYTPTDLTPIMWYKL